jgi:hypothetical protein
VLFAVEQLAPHAPQVSGEERFASQPLAAAPSQFLKPVAQTNEHVLLEQVRTAFSACGHTVVHVPQ